MSERPWLVLFAALLGCSSDPSSGTGSPSSAASTGGAGGSGGTGGAGASGSGGTSADPCGNLCAKLDSLGCPLAQCKTRCPEWILHAGDCGPQMAAEIDCIADSTTECGQDVCHAEFAALDACAGGVDCFSESCKGTGRGPVESCECSSGCSTGVIQTVCTTDATTTSCECFVGGTMVGTCDQTRSFCDLEFGCCAKYF